MARFKNPLAGVPETFRELRSDYSAAKDSRFKRTRTGLHGTGDAHYANELEFMKMREIARDMDRNDAVIGQMIDRACDNVCRTGFALDPATGDEQLDAELWGWFNEWAGDADQCDLAGERTFAEIARGSLRQTIVDGDHFVLPTQLGSLELVEAERCRSAGSGRSRKNVVHGVLLDENRRRREYWFTREVLDPFVRITRVTDMRRIPARDADGNRQVFHLYNPKRVSQTRGVTHLHPIVDVAGMFDDVNFAKLVQQQVVSCVAYFLERGADYITGSRTSQDQEDGTTQTLEEVTPGLFIKGRKGEKLTIPHGNVPNPEFFPHVKLLLTLIGINVGMPLVLVLMDASETNFSGWRGAFDQAKLGFMCLQEWLCTKLHRPTYRWKVRQWIEEGRIPRTTVARLGQRIFGHTWTYPKWPYLEPFKDSQADALQLEKGLTSPRRQQAARGNDAADVHRELVEDNANLIRRAHESAQQLGIEGLTWREVLNPFAAAAGKTSVTQMQDEDESEKSSGKETQR